MRTFLGYAGLFAASAVLGGLMLYGIVRALTHFVKV
jgi:hypothetical protein